MKHTIITLFVAACLAGILLAQPAANSSPSRPEAKITVRVVDQEGHPVTGARVQAGFYDSPDFGGQGTYSKDGLTSDAGTVSITMRTPREISFYAEKSGYYKTYGAPLGFREPIGDRWQPWNPVLEVPLKKIKQPVPMYAKSVELNLNATREPLGLDLMIGDWIAPAGRGSRTDIIFTPKLEKRSDSDYDYELKVSFPAPGDGIQPFSLSAAEPRSQFKSPYLAPEQGYQPQWIQRQSKRPGQPEVRGWDESRNYFFRVRTILDDKGNVKSALYGKMYGDFPRFRYYLNPEPNSRNVEFDPKQNLLKNLKRTEKVAQP